MRSIIILLFIFNFSCYDVSKKSKAISKSNYTKSKQIIKIEKNQEPKFKLDEKNSMEFFLQYDKENKETVVELETDMGLIEITLFKETKFHRSNFIYLAKKKYFKNTQFYRVINNFIIQAGNSDDRKISLKRKLIGKYLLPVDNNHGFKHSRGMVSMPSSNINNPHKLASPYEFFIVQSENGANFLDGDYTIFGKVTKGMDVVDNIARVETDGLDWPISNIFINHVKVIK